MAILIYLNHSNENLYKSSHPILSHSLQTIVSSHLLSGAFVSYDKVNNTVEFNIVNRRGPLHMVMNSPHICNMTFNSGWFEFEVAKIFAGWRYAHEVWMNVSFPASNNVSKNEIDIIVNLGHRLLFIECKTQLTKNTDIDKFHNAVNNYGGTGSLALFVTDENLSAVAAEKCKESNVLAFSFKSVYVRGRFNQNLWNLCRKELLRYLEQNINVINKK